MAGENFSKDIALGKGMIYFARFAEGTRKPLGERPLGNCPEFTLNLEGEALDHYNSTGGVREKDDQITLEVNRTFGIVCDQITPANLALIMFGEDSKLTQAQLDAEVDTLTVSPGFTYQLGVTDDLPSGQRSTTVTSLEDSGGAGTTYVAGTDYTVDEETGRVTIVQGGAILAETEIDITYDVAAYTRELILSGNEMVEGQLRFVANNPKGRNIDYLMPYVKLSPNGEMSLIGDSDWMTLPINGEALTRDNTTRALYADGRPMAGV